MFTSSGDLVRQRLNTIELLPELREALQQLVAYDETLIAARHWGRVIFELAEILGCTKEHIAPFAQAWNLIYAAILRLDHLQDDDPADGPLPAGNSPGAQYNLVISYFFLAMGLLDDLSPTHIPAQRILRLRRFWTDMILRAGSGQQCDLMGDRTPSTATPLEYYQQIAQAKTGSLYTLAFGGIAILASDAQDLIDALTIAGETYGTLVQLTDDLVDAEEQANLAPTLQQALETERVAPTSEETGHTPNAFWAYVYPIYQNHLAQVLTHVSSDVQHGILMLFKKTFEPN